MIERLNQLFQSLVQEHERMKHSLEEIRHWMSAVSEDYRRIAAQGDEAAMDKMIEQDRITFFAVGTLVYPVKSSGYRSVFIGPDLTTDMSTWWLVREKGSTEK